MDFLLQSGANVNVVVRRCYAIVRRITTTPPLPCCASDDSDAGDRATRCCKPRQCGDDRAAAASRCGHRFAEQGRRRLPPRSAGRVAIPGAAATAAAAAVAVIVWYSIHLFITQKRQRALDIALENRYIRVVHHLGVVPDAIGHGSVIAQGSRSVVLAWTPAPLRATAVVTLYEVEVNAVGGETCARACRHHNVMLKHAHVCAEADSQNYFRRTAVCIVHRLTPARKYRWVCVHRGHERTIASVLVSVRLWLRASAASPCCERCWLRRVFALVCILYGR